MDTPCRLSERFVIVAFEVPGAEIWQVDVKLEKGIRRRIPPLPALEEEEEEEEPEDCLL